MIYIASPENSPHYIAAEPYRRKLTCLLSPSLDPTQKTIAMGLTELESGDKSDSRGHEETETFFCISGHGHIIIDGTAYEMHPDMAVHVPSGYVHQICNDIGPGKMKLLWVLTSPFGGDRSVIEAWRAQNSIPVAI